jgi:uncharacterized membrane protein YfcA
LDFGSFADVLTRLVLGSGIGFIIGMTGIGAGVLLIPVLVRIGSTQLEIDPDMIRFHVYLCNLKACQT